MSERVLTGTDAERLRRAALTYGEVGATLAHRTPSGYRGIQRRRELGRGAGRFRQAAGALLMWDVHRSAGLAVRASDERVLEGGVAVLRLGVGRIGVNAPVRVVHLVDEPTRTGFAYGTLPGHPESGEEAFVIELQNSGMVTFTITAFSRPVTALARVGGPLTRVIQSWITSRYLRAG